jgi:hypothetical protein
MARKNQTEKLEYKSLMVEMVKLTEVKTYGRNSRTHNKEQVKQIAESISEFGFTNPVLVDSDNVLIAGHGRLEASRRLGLKEIPAIRLPNLTEDQKKALRIADNKLALNAGWDEELLRVELQELKDSDYNLDLVGFSEKELDELFGGESDSDETYTAKIESPVYEPKMEEPPEIQILCDTEKYKSLIKEIDASNIDEGIKEFLRMSATRHLSFDYKMIAEFYAHQPKEVQDLFEKSALVIIDFNKAIENGFVKMSQRLSDIMGDEDEE